MLLTNNKKENIVILGGKSHLQGGANMEVLKNYTVHIDNKKRVTLRGASFQYYNVREFENGCIILEPRELTTPEGISERTIADMDKAIENFKLGKVSPAIDLSDF